MRKIKRIDNVLSANFEPLLNEWGNEVKRRIPAANVYSVEDLNDGLKVFVEKMIEILSSPEIDQDKIFNSEDAMAGSKLHGKNRALNVLFEVDDVVLEYRILRKVCLNLLKMHAAELQEKDIENVITIVDNGLVFAVISFLLQREFKKEDISALLLKKSFGVEKVLAQIHQRIKDLETERSLREQFVLTLTHDLRNPLSAIKATAELMILKSSGHENPSLFCRELALRIVNDINRSDRMIIDLLDSSKNKADVGASLILKKFRLDNLIDDIIQSYKRVYGDRFVLKNNFKSNVNWNQDSIRRVIENLLTNSVKHGEKLGVIDIEVLNHESIVTISVRNKGVIISKDEIENLFIMFKQHGSEDKKGWGLGLTLVKGVVNSHGGSVRVDSCLENGITFCIDLPKDPTKYQPTLFKKDEFSNSKPKL